MIELEGHIITLSYSNRINRASYDTFCMKPWDIPYVQNTVYNIMYIYTFKHI